MKSHGGNLGSFRQYTPTCLCIRNSSTSRDEAQCHSDVCRLRQDPHTVLGGFPMDDQFRNFSADASTFVVTYPLNSSAANR